MVRPEAHVIGDVGKVPLFDAIGGLRGWAKVDADVLPWVIARGPWHLSTLGYVVRNLGAAGQRTTMALHRALLGLPAYGDPRISHRNDIRHDCRLSNLQVSGEWCLHQVKASPWLSQEILRLAPHAPHPAPLPSIA